MFSLLLQFGIFGITGFENRKFEANLQLGDVWGRQLHRQDAADDARDELKFLLAILNGALKDLNKNWDFTDIIRPLLADQGPATAFVNLRSRLNG